MDELKRLWDEMWGAIARMVSRDWDGSASRYDDTDQYCAACLLDLNSAAGRDAKAQSHCMLPVRNPGSDADDFEGIQAAAGGHGLTAVEKPDDVPQSDWDAARKSAASHIIAAYSEEDEVAPASIYEIAGKEQPEEERARALAMGRLFTRTSMAIDAAYPNDWVFLHDVFLDEGTDTWFAIGSSGGNLYQYPLAVTELGVTVGERIQVIENFTPAPQRTTVERQADGRYRWLSVSATALVNKDGEIDSTALFDDFERQASEDGYEWPYRCFYHLGETFRTGQTDFIARYGFALITSGVYDDTDIGRAEVEARLADPDGWRDSIHFSPTEAPELIEVGNVKIPVYRAGTFVEVTTAPADNVCSYGTTQTMIEEVNRMEKGDRQYQAFVQLFGDDAEKADLWLADHPDAAQRAVTDGAVARADGDAAPENKGDPELVERELVIDDELTAVIADQVLARLKDGPLAEMTTTLEALARQMEDVATARVSASESTEARLADLERTDEEKAEEIIQDMPRKEIIRVGYRPRHAKVRDGDKDGRMNLADVAAETLSKVAPRRVRAGA